MNCALHLIIRMRRQRGAVDEKKVLCVQLMCRVARQIHLSHTPTTLHRDLMDLVCPPDPVDFSAPDTGPNPLFPVMQL